ncbi:hypothetical protein ES703_99876 [subsurface metagenome]
MDRALIGLDGIEFLMGAAGLALLSFNFLLAEIVWPPTPPCPPCPPMCRRIRFVALGAFAVAAIAAWSAGDSLLGIRAIEWYVMFGAFGLLHVGGVVFCGFQKVLPSTVP